MKPAPPQTSSLIAPALRISCLIIPAAPRGTREPVLPRRQRQHVLALGLERRPGRPRRGPRHLRAASRAAPRSRASAWRKISRAKPFQDTPAPARWTSPRTPRSSRPSSAGARCPVQVGQPTWSSTTSTASRSPGEREHRGDEVAPAEAEQPGGPRDGVARRGLQHLALARRASRARRRSEGRWGRTRRRGAGVPRVVRRCAGEHVVGGDVQQRDAAARPPRARGCRRRRR